METDSMAKSIARPNVMNLARVLFPVDTKEVGTCTVSICFSKMFWLRVKQNETNRRGEPRDTIFAVRREDRLARSCWRDFEPGRSDLSLVPGCAGYRAQKRLHPASITETKATELYLVLPNKASREALRFVIAGVKLISIRNCET